MTRWTTSDAPDSTDSPEPAGSSVSRATIIASLLVLLGLVVATGFGSAGATALAPSPSSTARTALNETNRTLPVSGTIIAPDGSPLADDYVWSFGTDSRERMTTDGTGGFSLDTAGTLGFYQSTDDHYWRRDGIADMYSLGTVSNSPENMTVPFGRVLDVRVVDENGDPVPGASVLLSHHAAPDSSVGIRGETDADGFYRATDAPFTGLELTGTVSVIVRPPPTDERFVHRQYRRTLTVTSDTTVTVRLDGGRSSVDVSGTLLGPDGTPVSGTARIRTNRTFAPTTRQSVAVDGSGGFDTELPFDDQTRGLTFHHLSFVQDGFPRDDTPDLFAIDRFDGTHSRQIDRRLPAAFPTNVTVTHDGIPVRNASVTVFHRSGTGATASETFRTDADGRLRAGGSPGLELGGLVTIRAHASDSNVVVAEETRDIVVREPTEMSVSLAAAPPTVSAFSAPSSAGRGTTVELDVSASGAITEFRWDFDGDGTVDTTTTDSTVTHRYGRNGTVSPNVIAVGVESTATAQATISVTGDDDSTETGAGDGGGNVDTGTGGGSVGGTGSGAVGGGTGDDGAGSGSTGGGSTGLGSTAPDDSSGGIDSNASSRPETVVTAVPADDGDIALDLRHGRDGATAGTSLAGVEVGGVRLVRYGVTFGEDNVSTGLSLSARAPTGDEPNATLAVLDVETRYGRSGDIEAETVRVSVVSDSLPAGTTLADVVLYARRDGEWRRVHASRNGSIFSTTVSGVPPIAVGVVPQTVADGAMGEGTPNGTSTTSHGEPAGTTTSGTTTAVDATGDVPSDGTAPAFTGQVESNGQPGFGLAVSLVSLVLLTILVRERQRL